MKLLLFNLIQTCFQHSLLWNSMQEITVHPLGLFKVLQVLLTYKYKSCFPETRQTMQVHNLNNI